MRNAFFCEAVSYRFTALTHSHTLTHTHKLMLDTQFGTVLTMADGSHGLYRSAPFITKETQTIGFSNFNMFLFICINSKDTSLTFLNSQVKTFLNVIHQN